VISKASCAVLMALILSISPEMSSATAQEGTPRRAIGSQAYPEVDRLAKFFVSRSLVSIPSSYRIPEKVTGSQASRSPFYIPEGSPESLVGLSACAADVVVVAVPGQPTPFLGANDRWVFSEYSLQPQTILRKKEGPDIPTPMIYLHPGGSVRLSGGMAATEVSRYPALTSGEKYLFFLGLTSEAGVYRAINMLPMLQLSGAQARPASADYDAQAFAGLQEGDVSEWVVNARCLDRN
jgi:hypothetical protein